MASRFRTDTAKIPGLVRFSFTRDLFEPRAQKKDDGTEGKAKFGCTLIIPKKDEASMKFLIDMVLATAVGEWGENARAMLQNGMIKNPILEGDSKSARNKTTGEIHPGFGPDVVFIRCTSNDAPVVVAENPTIPITKAQAREFPSGYWGYAALHSYAWEHPQNGKGITFDIDLAQRVKADEVLGGDGGGPSLADAANFFSKVAEAAGQPAPSGAAAGAGGMFGQPDNAGAPPATDKPGGMFG